MPAKIGRYRIVDRIGRGAMGVVYSAQDEMMGRPVALKVLIADLETDPDTRARFYREAQAAARLLHPNIITIFDAGEDQGRSYIAMQLLEGYPLTVYLKRPEAAPIERKLDLMVQICEGLAAAHGRGVVHRDLKPGNLFVQADGLLKILDFGVARLADSSMTAAGVMLGTPDYMSPEQARGTQVDARSDVFSAGAVFYFMLAGRKPFPGPDLPAVLHQLQFESPAALGEPEAPPALASLVLHAMEKDPAARPARVQDLLAALVRFRRRYQAETRSLAASARTQYEIVESLASAVEDAGAVLGIPANPADSPVLASLRDRFPILAQRGAAALDAIPFDRSRVTFMLQELEMERQRLAADVEMRRSHAATIDAGQRTLAAGDARDALRLFERVAAAVPLGTRARALADACRPLAREQEEREQHVQSLLAAAREAHEMREWASAAVTCGEALALWPRHEAASALLAEVQQAVAREQRRQALMLQRFLDRAARAIEQHRFDEAGTALKEADALQPGAPAVAELRHRLADARAAAEAADLLRQLTSDEIRRARSMFRRGRHHEALQQLRSFVNSEPEAYEAIVELDRLVELGEGLAVAAAARREKVGEILAVARSMADRGMVDEGLARTRDAMRVDPGNADAAGLYDDLLRRDLEQRIAREHARATSQRSVDADPLLAAAKDAFARGYLSLAADAADAATRVAPDRADAAELAERLRALMRSEDTAPAEFGETIVTRPSVEQVEPAPVPPQSDAGGVLSQVNSWAADFLRRWPAKS